jgi:probable rRNA maturation factor
VSTTEIDVVREAGGWDALPGAEEVVLRAARAALAQGGADVRAGAELCVLLTDDAAIRGLNKGWRGKDKPTNVLSFPACTPSDLPTSPALGDVVVAWETLAREAADEGKPMAHHLAHLVVHGVLHLLGHDHETTDQAETMEALEIRILAGMGIPDPYAGSELDAAEPDGRMIGRP